MKFTSAALFAFAATALASPIANPAAEAEALPDAELAARATGEGVNCKIVRNNWFDLHGTCVDTTKAHSCDGGTSRSLSVRTA